MEYLDLYKTQELTDTARVFTKLANKVKASHTGILVDLECHLRLFIDKSAEYIENAGIAVSAVLGCTGNLEDIVKLLFTELSEAKIKPGYRYDEYMNGDFITDINVPKLWDLYKLIGTFHIEDEYGVERIIGITDEGLKTLVPNKCDKYYIVSLDDLNIL